MGTRQPGRAQCGASVRASVLEEFEFGTEVSTAEDTALTEGKAADSGGLSISEHSLHNSISKQQQQC